MLARDKILQGRYRIISQLGHGGMGAVYEAEDKKRFDASVALKEILIDLADVDSKQHDLLKHAFEREAKILAEVHHEVFPHVIEYFSEGDRQYLVMELIQGADLAQLLMERKAPFPIEEILFWTDQLLDALDYLHSYNPPIFHRDLKPQNLKLTSRRKIKLLDFGIAKSEEGNLTATITNQTFIAATLNYSPFEQILRVIDSTLREVITQRYEEKIKRILEQPADAQSDLYALGATLYHLSTGFVPTDALKRTLEVWSDKPDPLRRPHDLNPEIPEEISQVFLKAMEIERENRFASAMEMQQALNKAVAEIKRREREAAKKLEEEAQRAMWLAEQAQLEKERQEKERQLAIQERLRIQAEHLRQAELIERQLKEAEIHRQQTEQERLRIEAEQARLENERQFAEQERLRIEAELAELHRHEASIQRQIADSRTSETEERLAEKENIGEIQPAVAATQFADGLTQQSYLTGILSDPNKQSASPDVAPFKTGDLPFTHLRSRKNSRLLPIAAMSFLIFGGLILGAWFLLAAKPEEATQIKINQTSFSANEATPEPTVEATPEPTVTPPLSASPEPTATPVSRSPVAPKPAAPRIEKPTPQQPKPTPNPKKPVTIDDILNRNRPVS